ncbi:MAG: two-component system response regulator AtoC [Myxococcota bacterium]|jgi:two-component system response regulator AtoC
MSEHVLIVDDTPQIVRLLAQNLENHGYTVSSTTTGTDALTILRDEFRGIVILDLNLPDYQELALFHEIRRINDSLPIIIITAHGTIDMAIEATRLGAFDFLTKTEAFFERVYVSTKNAFAQLELSSRLEQLSSELRGRYKFDQIISISDGMRPVFDLMSHAADSRVTVLVQGESGTGKELIARALHYNGSRSRGPFVPVNCAGIPENLLESELFGVEKGAFTGAHARRRGKFEQADGGTLFLDEIGEMPMVLQSKLLRALQERTIERLGGGEPIKLDLRFVCATNRDLKAEVRAGRFREDLYYRLAVFPITLPPLRDRRGDITLLAQHFLERAAKEENKVLTGFEDAALHALAEHDFPGNVRELQNVISHAVVVVEGPRIRKRDLPPGLRGPESEYDRIGSSSDAGYLTLDEAVTRSVIDEDHIPTMEAVEAMLIARAVELCEGNFVRAAGHLGMSRATIYRRIGKLGLKR